MFVYTARDQSFELKILEFACKFMPGIGHVAKGRSPRKEKKMLRRVILVRIGAQNGRLPRGG